jgi:hypothetical protein
MTDHILNLGWGAQLRCSMDSLDDSVLVGVGWRGIPLPRRRFDRATRHRTLKLPLLPIELGVWVDVFAGEVRAEWRAGRVRRDVVVRFDPAVGEIGGTVDFVEPVVDDPRFGRSQLCTPAILRMHVDDGKREISDAGRLVKETLFPEEGPFVFNTIACVGEADGEARGAYPNPSSPWFNLFFGCYQIDVPRPAWSRPFGYRAADGVRSQVAFDDITKLGKADWNFFSNWMYGVPRAAIDPHNGTDPVATEQRPEPERIGETLWHSAAIEGVTCVSTYESDTPGAGRLVTNSLIDDVWRRAFGLPNPQRGSDVSFVPTTLRAEFHMAYTADDAAYHTLICGGTARVPVDRELLDAQMAAIRTVIETGYPACGFPAS